MLCHKSRPCDIPNANQAFNKVVGCSGGHSDEGESDEDIRIGVVCINILDVIQGSVSDKIATRIKRQTYNTESEQEVLEEELSAFDEVKSVSKSLMKAIVKPTVSHISDAYKWREVRKFFSKTTVFTSND